MIAIPRSVCSDGTVSRNSGSRLFVYGDVESNRQSGDSQARKAALYTNEAKYSSIRQYDKTGQYPHCCSFHPCMIALNFVAFPQLFMHVDLSQTPRANGKGGKKYQRMRETVSISH